MENSVKEKGSDVIGGRVKEGKRVNGNSNRSLLIRNEGKCVPEKGRSGGTRHTKMWETNQIWQVMYALGRQLDEF